MDIGIISSRYAKALFSLAKEKGQESRVYEDMKMLANSFSEEPGLEDAINNPIIPADEKFKLLITAGGVEVSDLYKRFIHLLLEHKRENFLLFMAHVYIHLYREDKRITRVLFSTAVPVNDEVKIALKNSYQEIDASSYRFIVGNKDWFIAIDNRLSLITYLLPYDERAKDEYLSALGKVNELIYQFTKDDDSNLRKKSK